MPKFSFVVTHLSSDTNARVSEFTLHDKIELPIFMPVATYGAMRTVPVDDLKHDDLLHGGIILSNTYHLRNLNKNIKMFMNYNQSMLTDSGGFQIQSLPCEITDDGVEFTLENKIFSSKIFRPEDSMAIQHKLCSDIIMQLDDVVNPLEDKNRHKIAVDRSIKWLDRAIDELIKLNSIKNNTELTNVETDSCKKIKNSLIFNNQTLFPIIQGGLNEDLRKKSVNEILMREPAGLAIGGMCGGEDKISFANIISYTVKYLQMKCYRGPIYVMGVGYPDDIVICCGLGTDMSDCVYPTRMGRNLKIFRDGADVDLRRMNEIKKQINDITKINKLIDTKLTEITKCDCELCSYNVYYIHINKNIPNVVTLASKHNMKYMRDLCARIRENIKKDRYKTFIEEYFRKKYGEGIPEWIKTVCNKEFNIEFK